MTVGIVELAIVFFVGTLAGIAFLSHRHLWLVPLAGFLALAAIFTAADILSTLLFAFCAFAIHRGSARRRDQAAG